MFIPVGRELMKAPLALLIAVVALFNPFEEGGLFNPHEPRVMSPAQLLEEDSEGTFSLQFSWLNIGVVPVELDARVVAFAENGSVIQEMNGAVAPNIFTLEIGHPKMMVGSFPEIPKYLVACASANSLESEWANSTFRSVYKRFDEPFEAYGLASKSEEEFFVSAAEC